MLASEKIALLLFMCAVGAVYLFEAAIAARAVQSRIQGESLGKILRAKHAIVVHVLAILGVCCFFYGRFIEPGWIEVNRFKIRTPKLNQTSFRIVQISDLHCEVKPLNEEKIVPLINGMDPDLIVFTGDAVNGPHGVPLFKKTMGALKAKLGKLAVRGNFETGRRGNLDLYSGTGFRLLEQDSVVLEKNGESLRVLGLRCDRPAEAEEVLGKASPECFNVFLCHWSDLIEDASRHDVDLYLCGHTHGGQIALPFYGAIITLSKFGKKYESGMYTVGKKTMYVNRGLGMEPSPAPRLRFLARPEVAVFDIVPQR